MISVFQCFDLKVPLAIERKYARSRWNACCKRLTHTPNTSHLKCFILIGIDSDRASKCFDIKNRYFLPPSVVFSQFLSTLEFHSLHFKRSTYSTTHLYYSPRTLQSIDLIIWLRAHILNRLASGLSCFYKTNWNNNDGIDVSVKSIKYCGYRRQFQSIAEI